jgi:hypothetical protein
MVAYDSISVVRTDGQFKIITKSGVVEMNQPTHGQLDDTPDAHGMISKYRLLDPNGTKALDWRRKLGGMLVQLLGGEEHIGSSIHFSRIRNTYIRKGKNYILGEFPEGYALWEHCKYHKDGTAFEKKQKNKHAAGGHERQDAYLYGHPHGRKKRYRSPADFFPHLLWLACDTEGDSLNCSCKICSPDGDEDTQLGIAKVEVIKEPKPPPPSRHPSEFSSLNLDIILMYFRWNSEATCSNLDIICSETSPTTSKTFLNTIGRTAARYSIEYSFSLSPWRISLVR